MASDKPDGETASTGSAGTGITGPQSKADSNKARVTEQQAKEKHRLSRLAGFYPQEPKVGFKIDESPEKSAHKVDNMLDAINRGETDGMDTYATLNDLDAPGFQTRDTMAQHEEDEFNAAEEAEKKRLEEQRERQKFFMTKDQRPFNPEKRFGTIEDRDTLIYDNITTSYPLNLPSDFYLKTIQRMMPDKQPEDKWFIRPHHIESITQHASSIRDDFLNTRYYSHYDNEKPVKLTDKEQALQHIEQKLETLRSKSQQQMISRGFDPDALDELRGRVRSQALKDYDEFLFDKTRFDNKELCIRTYEHILKIERIQEGKQLNAKRKIEYDKNRPPLPGWYEGKDAEFCKEVFRNRVELRPRGQNSEYLNTLADQSIY